MIKGYKADQLQERCDEYNRNGVEMYGEDAEQMSLRDYTEREAENDPNFFSWLFDTDEEVTDEQMEEYQEWLEEL
ncbi:MAG: hypothetical protein IAB99_07260 [Bacteroidetes bacterium]|uniref:Uncharacterized protein n=1 Tax=Candidatus Cryptobacteroides faecipullorum TaxID=2840764 RepID=A0A9D9I9L0_9BACT|nr:hypothetical protein [Candidatus Cryptobacteroides faecipullorum]